MNRNAAAKMGEKKAITCSKFRHVLVAVLIAAFGCTNRQYRFEQIDSDPPVVLPLRLDSFEGLRDGATVNATARFSEGQDSVVLNLVLFLRPPAEFRTGMYQGIIAGRMVSGVVECPSLTFQGGQTALPSVGGIFILKDGNNTPVYRITVPSTALSSRNSGRE